MIPSNISDKEFFKYYVKDLEIQDRGLIMADKIIELMDSINDEEDSNIDCLISDLEELDDTMTKEEILSEISRFIRMYG